MAKRTTAATQRTGLRYIGDGAYFPGLPARDLNAADLVAYAGPIAEMEQAGTLGTIYEPVEESAGSLQETEEGADHA